jgi:hypothetical protein
VADLQINYDRLHELANSTRILKAHLNDTVPGLTTGLSGFKTNAAGLGDAKVASALTKFDRAWDQPFKDAMDRLGELANLLDGVATKFFDMDSDFAARASSGLAALVVKDWQSRKNQYDLYQRTKDLMFQPSPLWGSDGKQHAQAPVPLVPWSNIPTDPGPRPTRIDADVVWRDTIRDPNNPKDLYSDGTPTVTDSRYDDKGRVISQTTTVFGTSGLAYSETTTYTYNGNSETPSAVSTKIRHSDLSVETIDTTNNPDGTSTVKNTVVDPANSKNNSSSTTTITPKDKPPAEGQPPKPESAGYTAVTVDDKGKKTTVDITNNPGTSDDTKVVTDDKGVVRGFKGNAVTDNWTQISGPAPGQKDPAGKGQSSGPDPTESKDKASGNGRKVN